MKRETIKHICQSLLSKVRGKTAKSFKRNVWFVLGIGSIAAVLGYMVGASKTPVVGVAIPAIFALVLTAVGLVSGASIGKKFDAVKELVNKAESSDIEKVLDAIRSETKTVPNRLGKVLLGFTILYAIGLLAGTRARVNNWFAPAYEQQLPWISSNHPPPTASEAVDWIALQEQLIELGYNRTQIDQIYSIQVAEWNSKASSTYTSSAYTNSSRPSLPEKLDGVLRYRVQFQNPVPLQMSTPAK